MCDMMDVWVTNIMQMERGPKKVANQPISSTVLKNLSNLAALK